MKDSEIIKLYSSERPVKEITRDPFQQIKLIRLRIINGYYLEIARVRKILEKIYNDILK